ncbi:hypothetical protein HAX54_012003 [Datura stramonium]|uniref:Uncharacterized protein n=1 Tax=Datura stramonium TaxID=4076 RepID=A0ABS8TJ36_DATST|nr:hypothetical protein [Datura stramonium]
MTGEIIERLQKFSLTEEEKESIEIAVQDFMSSMEHCEKVLYRTPWLYDMYLLNIHPWKSELNANSQIFNICDIWLQVWNIPPHWISYEVDSKIEHALRGTSDVAIPENGSKDGRHLCLRVLMSIKMPLPWEKLIKVDSEKNG